MSEQAIEEQAPATPVTNVTPEDDQTTFTAEYVKELRDEAAAHRVKSKRVDDANVRLATSYASATGRLVDVDAFTFTDDMLGEDGLVDEAKVRTAVDALIEAKPYLARRTPITPIAQGVQPEAPETPGLFALIRARS